MIKKNLLLKTVFNLSLCVIFLGISPVRAMQGDEGQQTSDSFPDGSGPEHLLPKSFLLGIATDFAELWASMKDTVTYFASHADTSSKEKTPDAEEPSAEEMLDAPAEAEKTHPKELPCLICFICKVNALSGPTFSYFPSCYHVFHTSCITGWLTHSAQCPTCSESITETDLQTVSTK